jgi:hypothetical protein
MFSLQLPSQAARHVAATAGHRALLVATLAPVVFACSDPPAAPTASPPARPALSESPASLAAASSHLTDYKWSSGQGPIPMGSISGRVCFLTRVSGMFGVGRSVRIYAANGSWWLTGSSVGVSAWARCSNSYSSVAPPEYSWSQGQNPTYMGSIYGRACFLTRVGGDFEGTSERVEVFSGNSSSWWLGGSSVQAGVSAGARCVVYPPYLPKQPYSYTGWFGSGSGAHIVQPTSWACYLAGMSGDFEGSASYIHIFASGGSWYARAGTSTLPTAVKAGCTSK